MRWRFSCHICSKQDSQERKSITRFVFAYWYTETSGLEHGCLYCRSCGAVHDTVGTILGGIKLLFGGFPSKVVVAYRSESFKQKAEMGEINIIPGVVGRAMIEDGRLSPDWGDSVENLMRDGIL